MNIKQFEELLNEANMAYNKSNLKNKDLYYSLVGTQIKPNQPLIVGLNWGGGSESDTHQYQPDTIENYQKLIEKESNFMNIDDIGSLNNIKPYLEKHISNISKVHIGWTNYCLFRTPDDTTLTNEAMILTQPIFLKLIDIINPSIVLCFSSEARDFLLAKNNFEVLKTYKATNENEINKYNGVVGKLNGIKFYFLPHPASHTGNVARDYAWNFCFEK